MKPELLAQRLATFRTKKAADARILAECARVAKDVVFVAADDSQAVITAEMRELTPRRSIYWPTGRDDEA